MAINDMLHTGWKSPELLLWSTFERNRISVDDLDSSHFGTERSNWIVVSEIASELRRCGFYNGVPVDTNGDGALADACPLCDAVAIWTGIKPEW